MGQARQYKILTSTFLLVVTISVVLYLRNPINQNGYIMYRLGSLAYNLDPNSAQFIHKSSIYAEFGSMNSGVDIIQQFNQYPLLASYISTLSRLLGTSVLAVYLFPIIPIGGFVTSFLFGRELTGRFDTGIVLAILITLRYTIIKGNTMPKPFGRYIFLFIGFFALLRLLQSHKYQKQNSFFTIIILSYFGVKYTSPKVEVIFLATIFAIVALALAFSHILRSKLTHLSILFLVIFMSNNPKFYIAFFSAIGEVGPVAVSSSSPVELFFRLPHRILTTILGSANNMTHPLIYTPTTPTIHRYISLIFFGILALAASVFGVQVLWKREWNKLLTPSIFLLISLGFAGIFDFIYRGILLDRTSLIGVYLAILLIGLLSFSHLTDKMPRIRRMGFAVLLVLTLVSSVTYVSIAIDSPRITPAASDEFSEWNYQFSPNERIMTGHKIFSTIRYFYGANAYPEFWEHIKLIRYTTERYNTLISGKDPGNIGHYVVNRRSLDKPIEQGPPRWRKFEPLAPRYDAIKTNTHINRIYSNGNYHVYTSE